MKLLKWLTNNRTLKIEYRMADHLTSKERFNFIISDTISPFPKANGYVKKALTFYIKLDNLIFVINFQNSQGNIFQINQFYINCGIYSKIIDATIGKDELLEPKEYDCHYRVRISSIKKNKIYKYEILDSTELELLKAQLLNDLGVTNTLFDRINTTSDLTDLMIETDCYDKK